MIRDMIDKVKKGIKKKDDSLS